MYFISVLKWASGAHILTATQRMGSQLLSCNSSIIFGYRNIPVLSGFIKSLIFLLQAKLDLTVASWKCFWVFFKTKQINFSILKWFIFVVTSATWPFKLSFLGAHFFHLGKWNCLPNLEKQKDFKLLFTKRTFPSLLCLGWQFVRYPHKSWRPVCFVFF